MMRWLGKQAGETGVETAAPSPTSAPSPDPMRPRITRGTPTRLADGRVWLLADFIPDLDDRVWDELYDQNVALGRYQPVDLRRAAVRLLMASYDLDIDHAVSLVRDADPIELRQAVELAMFEPKDGGLTFTDWMKAGLALAGHADWRSVPPGQRKKLIGEMVGSGRLRPSTVATAVGRVKADRDRIRGAGRRVKAGA